jgi:hypothetical protein
MRNAFDAGSIHYLGKWEGVGPWKSQLFWASNGMALAYRLNAISQGPKKSQFPGPNPLPLGRNAARIKSITHGAV